MKQISLHIKLLLLIVMLPATHAMAYEAPEFNVYFDCTDTDDEEQKGILTFEGSAPIKATFHYDVENADGWNIYHEWRICHESENLDRPYLVRREDSPEITFSSAGQDSIGFYAICTRNENGIRDTLIYWRNYWTKEQYLTVKASTSELTFPNAFSPNNDGANDTYKPKTYKSIIDFHAIIYNRWGHKVYEWTDVKSDGWDGTINGHDAKQGVYFILCKAKGADGRKFEIRKDVNLLRSSNGETSGSSSGGDF